MLFYCLSAASMYMGASFFIFFTKEGCQFEDIGSLLYEIEQYYFVYFFFITVYLLNYSSFFLRLRIMSSVIFSRSYCGFQPHSLRAQLSSILSGQLSAMACLMGSGS